MTSIGLANFKNYYLITCQNEKEVKLSLFSWSLRGEWLNWNPNLILSDILPWQASFRGEITALETSFQTGLVKKNSLKSSQTYYQDHW